MSESRFLTPREQVEHCLGKGIGFTRITETDAEQYLVENNNYFKLRAFRKNFPKSAITEKYINLDFRDLIDLACIDNRLRKIMLEMAISIEHFSKVYLLGILQQNNVDSCDIIDDYINQLSQSNRDRLNSDLLKNSNSLYCGDLYAKYIADATKRCPVWAFLEIISFGQYLHFYEFCISVVSDKELKERLYLMRTVKDLRNACAHNNCIINNINATYKRRANADLEKACVTFLVSPSSRRRHLRHISTYQILATMYTHQRICTSKGVHSHMSVELAGLKNRFFRDNSYRSNDTVQATFNVFIKAIDIWFSNV